VTTVTFIWNQQENFSKGALKMPTVKLIEYEDASPEVKAVYDDIMATRQVDWINNVWKALAVQPAMLKMVWDNVREATKPGAIDAVTKEMIYVAISATNGCEYCINSHTAAARKKGMTDEMHSELLALIGVANQTNALLNALNLEVDKPFLNGGLDSQ
jgi:AhpD family alkylhydroperoxidase